MIFKSKTIKSGPSLGLRRTNFKQKRQMANTYQRMMWSIKNSKNKNSSGNVAKKLPDFFDQPLKTVSLKDKQKREMYSRMQTAIRNSQKKQLSMSAQKTAGVRSLTTKAK